MPFNIIRNDITKINVEAIVNAANTELAMGGGVCGAIFAAAGHQKLQEACRKLAPIKTGEAVITPGFDLPAKYIIHAAGPVYMESRPEQSEKLLRAAYHNSLQLALDHKCSSIAFPLISSGIYGYPKKEALRVATSVIQSFLKKHEMTVNLIIFDKDALRISENLFGAIENYLDEHYVREQTSKKRILLNSELKDLAEESIEASEAESKACYSSMATEVLQSKSSRIQDLVGNLDEPFSDTLLRLIDAKGMKDAEVYKRANIDRKLFSKIRTIKGYTPSKRTTLALAVALKLNLQETNDLLRRAGYALSHSLKFDVIIEYFIINERYDIYDINEVLFNYDQPLLGL